ncbi:MAG: FAD-dependent oxidoreductase [Clostridia bacterium]|jgi:fumarate reductase flavoprotein subunit|nr:FAD-dependent oxidoreductase [Clostridia bacterium]
MKQLNADVVVIAAGPSGLAAAIAAAEGGATVIAFEKAHTTGGTGNMGMGLLAVESKMQRQKQIGLTVEEAFKEFMDYTHWRVDARLVKAYLDKTASTIDWLEEMGVEFTEPAAYFPGSHFTWHIVKPPTGRPGPLASATMIKAMTKIAEELGVQLHLKTPVKQILKEGDRIVGVLAEDESGETIQANAKAVVIATGGFGNNPEWVKKHTGYQLGEDMFSFRVPGLVGDGIRMAWEMGAAETEMTMEIIYGIPGSMGFSSVSETFRQPNLMVNLLGERFINEEQMVNTTYTGNAISLQKNRCAFTIFDEATKKYYEQNGLDRISPVFNITSIENFDSQLDKAIESGNVFAADSLEELAEKTGINYQNLQQTVTEYNHACDTRDELFYKSNKYLKKITQPKFYAARFYPGAYGTLGGIKINYKTEVLTKYFETIPGLYAVGTDSCSIYGDSYVFILPGNTMSFAINSGRIAGENAVEYIKSL